MRRSQDQPALVQLLLEHKASASIADATGSTALYYAALSGCLAAVDLLKAAAGDGFGAAVNAANANGETPLMAAAASGATEVCALLIASGADLGAKATAGDHEGSGALDIARRNMKMQTATFLKTKVHLLLLLLLHHRLLLLLLHTHLILLHRILQVVTTRR